VSLQLNLFLPSATVWDRYSRNATTNVMYPIVWTLQSTTGTEAQAERLTGSVTNRVILINTFFYVGMGIGFVSLLCVGLWIANEVRRARGGYSEL
jgi:hypothetical protein